MKVGTTGSKYITLNEIQTEYVNSIIFTFKSFIGLVKKTYPNEVGFENGKFRVDFSQEDTLKLSPSGGSVEVKCEAQINYKSGSVQKSDCKSWIMEHTLATTVIGKNHSDGENTGDIELELNGEIIVVNNGEGGSIDAAEVQKIVKEYISSNKEELKGEKGDKGSDGVNGKDGIDGVDGSDGSDGKSAYDIAVDNGFEGTEAEWLESLKADVKDLVSTTTTEEVKEWVEQEIEIKDGWYNVNDGSILTSSTNYIYTEIECVEGEKYRITGACGSSGKFPFIQAYASDGTLVEKYGITANESFNDYEYTIPSGAIKLIINGHKTKSGLKLYKYISVEGKTEKVYYVDFNPLVGKKIGVDGDSICYGAQYEGGYAKIIAENNNMTYQNIGVGGATLTRGTLESAGTIDWSKNQYYIKRTAYFDASDLKFAQTVAIPINEEQYNNGFGVYPTLYTVVDGVWVEHEAVTEKPIGNYYIKWILDNAESTIDVYTKLNYNEDSFFDAYKNGLSSETLYTAKHWLCESVTALNEDCDYIIIEGGLNDYLGDRLIGSITKNMTDEVNTYTVVGAMEYMCRQILTKYVGKKIGYVFIHKSANKTTGIGYAYTEHKDGFGTLTDYFDAMKTVLRKYGVPYCDLFNESTFCTELVAHAEYTGNGKDRIHPTKEGYELFYVPKITSWLKML